MIGLAVLALGLSIQVDPDVEMRLRPEFGSCMKASGGVTASMLDCIAAETAWQDRALNATYRRVRTGLDDQEKRELRDIQRAWIRARDATCQSRAADDGGGSLSGVTYADCIMTQTAARVVWLESQYLSLRPREP